MNAAQLAQFTAAFTQLSQQFTTLASSLDALGKQLTDALKSSSNTKDQEIKTKLEGYVSYEEYQTIYYDYAIQQDIDACIMVYKHSITKGNPRLIGPQVLEMIFNMGKHVFERVLDALGLLDFPKGESNHYQFEWLKECGLLVLCICPRLNYLDETFETKATFTNTWLGYYLYLYINNVGNMTMFQNIVNFSFPVVRTQLDLVPFMVFSNCKHKPIDEKCLPYIEWILTQVSLTYKFCDNGGNPDDHFFLKLSNLLPKTVDLLSNTSEIKQAILTFMSTDKEIEAYPAVYMLFLHLINNVYNVSTSVNSIKAPEETQKVVDAFKKVCERHNIACGHFTQPDLRLNIIVRENRVFTLDTQDVFLQSNLQDIEDYLTYLICITLSYHVLALNKTPYSLQYVLAYNHLFDNNQWIHEILPIEIWQTSIAYTIRVTTDAKERLDIVKTCLFMITRYFAKIANIKQQIRHGNNIKGLLTSWFSFIGNVCVQYNIKLTNTKELQAFWVDMIQYGQDIRWFILHCAVKWSASENMSALIDALKFVKVEDFTQCLSRDTTLLLKKVSKGKYLIHDYIVELLEHPSSDDTILQHLTDLHACKFDFSSNQMYMYYAYKGVYKHGGSNKSITFLEERGLKKWKDDVHEMIKMKNVDQMWLFLAKQPGSYESAFAECYEICASKGWYEQAMWLYELGPSIPFIKQHILIHPQALTIAEDNEYLGFVDNSIYSQKLHLWNMDAKHLLWVRNAGILSSGVHITVPPTWHIRMIAKYIFYAETNYEIFKEVVFPIQLIGHLMDPLLQFLFVSWAQFEDIPVAKLQYVDWILSRCELIDKCALRADWTESLPKTSSFICGSNMCKHLIKKLLYKDGHEEHIYTHFHNVYLLFRYALQV